MFLRRLKRFRILRLTGLIASILAFVYIITSLLIAYGFSMPARATPARTPGDYEVAFEDVVFPSGVDRVELSGWYLPGSGEITIIILPGGRSSREDLLALSVDLAAAGYNVLSLDRRGCGLSAVPSLGNRGHIERDFQGAVAYIRDRSGGDEQIFLLGNSIGALAAFVYTSQNPGVGLRGIIADSAFATREAIAARVLNQALPLSGVFAPGALFLGERLFGLPDIDAIDIVGGIEVPILFIGGDSDEQIPVEATYALYEASGNPSDEILIVPGAVHSLSYQTDPSGYVEQVVSFIDATTRVVIH